MFEPGPSGSLTGSSQKDLLERKFQEHPRRPFMKNFAHTGHFQDLHLQHAYVQCGAIKLDDKLHSMSHTWPRVIFIFIVKGLWLVSSWRQADAGLASSGIHLRQDPTPKGFSGSTCQFFCIGMDCSLGFRCKRFGKYARRLWQCSFWFILWKVLGRLLVFTPWCLSCIFNDFRLPLKQRWFWRMGTTSTNGPTNGPTGQWETGQGPTKQRNGLRG